MSALGILSGLAKAACVIDEIYDTYKQIEALQNNAGLVPNNLPPTMRKAVIATKVSVICLTTIDVIGSVFGMVQTWVTVRITAAATHLARFAPWQ